MFLVLLALVACDMGPTYKQIDELDKAGTEPREKIIAAYEEFLARDPDSIYKFAIDKRLEELYYERAIKDGALASWKAYLERFPEGPHKTDAQREVAIAAYGEAVKTGTAEALRKFVADYPRADRWLVARAEGRAAVLEYGKLTLSEPVVTEVNMAEDPKGPLNGWGVAVDVANEGDQTFAYVSLTLEFLADDGHVLAVKDYPLVSPTWNVPASEEQMRPLKPAEKRTWVWTESKEPDQPSTKWRTDWHQKVRVAATGLKPVK